jgi:hypothetical protein
MAVKMKMIKTIKDAYIKDFKKGVTHNYYINDMRFVSSDNWIRKKEWIEIAKCCINSKTNILQALEILIVEDFKTFYFFAKNTIEEWYLDDAHDVNNYYNILAFFPKENFLRKKFLENYASLISYDSWG